MNWRDKWMSVECLVRIANFDAAIRRFGDLDVASDGLEHNVPDATFKAAFCLWRARAHLALHNKTEALRNLHDALQLDRYNVNVWQMLADEELLNDKELLLVWKRYWGSCLLEDNATTPDIMSPKTPMRPSADDDDAMDDSKSVGASATDASSLLENDNVIGLNIGLLVLRDQAPILQHLEQHYNDVFQSEYVQWKLAKWLLKQEKYEQAYSIASKFLELNEESVARLVAMTRERVITFLTCLVQLKRKDELFYFGHNLVEKHAHLCESWFAVGAYYYCIENYTQAEKYFKKAVGMDEGFLDAWLALGHVLSYKDDSEQALQAYRSAHRLFPGVHNCVLCIGMEYAKTNNLQLAEKFVLQARDMCDSNDPLVHNELGVIKFKLQQYSESLHHYLYALSLKPSTQITTPEQWSAIHYNIGHCYRKLQCFSEAIHHYTEALALSPNDGSIYCSIGFTYHLNGNLNKAIEYYHHSLGQQFEDQHFAAELLSKALKAVSEMQIDELVPAE